MILSDMMSYDKVWHNQIWYDMLSYDIIGRGIGWDGMRLLSKNLKIKPRV